MTSPKPQWNDLSPRQKTAVRVAVSVELALTATALVELARRPKEQIRGSKAAWAIGCAVQPIGPIAFLLWGRRR